MSAGARKTFKPNSVTLHFNIVTYVLDFWFRKIRRLT